MDMREEWQRRANAGDPVAASSLFRALFTCEMIDSTLTNTPIMATFFLPPGVSIDDVEPSVREDVLRQVDEHQPEEDFAKAHAGYCAGSEGAVDDHARYAAALQAAKLGDELAASCFVVGASVYMIGEHDSFDVVGGPPPNNPTDPWIKAQYQENALALAERGVEKGDWSMVTALEGFYSDNDILFAGRLTQPDRAMHYAYSVLWALGARESPDDAVTLEAPMDADGLPLSLEVTKRAEAWANETYARHFAGIPQPENGFRFCDLR
jgi:hypothetical protein